MAEEAGSELVAVVREHLKVVEGNAIQIISVIVKKVYFVRGSLKKFSFGPCTVVLRCLRRF
jgi:hypothetical protein